MPCTWRSSKTCYPRYHNGYIILESTSFCWKFNLSMGLQKCLSLPVFVVLLVIGFVYHTIMFLVIEPWLSLRTVSGLFNGTLFTMLSFMVLLSYGLAVLRDPGQVPASYMPEIEDSDTVLHEVKRKGGDLRYCQKCRHYKPPRAHHCRVCKRCVLRMDHHCVWINNCVGHNNYKPFFLFVVYVVGACIQALILLGGHTMQHFGAEEQNLYIHGAPPLSTSVAVSALLKVLCATMLLPLLVALAVLLIWHVYLALHNKTTIEYHEGVRARWLAEKAGQSYRHPYNLGIFSNLSMVFGPNSTCWFCPTSLSHIGPGIRFQTMYDKVTRSEFHLGG
ncbi:hypothetical protein O6H91_04G009800 [Diphasiastrum complanatum]|uniref:Uncharacterized protein n=1 Tax=Diphasiastrum complanatum TaxID=34168 RepID=A0ACC2DUD0_DIPCM|nr:hypothetical protein O6H91_Y498700 [Diphasiastrum complanatum]KAJ7557782.1 hypothetical protein O6H91_04G009800 [Diphasiastrum complanatum]